MKKHYRDPLLEVIGCEPNEAIAGMSGPSAIESATISDADESNAF